MIYLDWAASTPIEDEVIDLIHNSLVNEFANPSAAHRAGKDLLKKVDHARVAFKKYLGASETDNIIFTSSATEANNTLIKGFPFAEGDKVYYNCADHPSLVKPIERVALEKNLTLRDVNEYSLDAIDPDTKMVLLTHIHGQNGKILDLENCISSLREQAPNVYIHVDAVQSFGKIPLDVKQMGIDSLALSSHKICGPKGVGLLYFNSKEELHPLLDGGGHENGYRSSTLPAPFILGFEAAARIKTTNRSSDFEQMKKLKLKLEDLLSRVEGTHFLFQGDGFSPYICCFVLDSIPSDVLMRHLEVKNIFIASSSACSSKMKGFNPTFEKLGIPKEYHKNVLRISIGPKTTESEINDFTNELNSIVQMIKGLKKK